MASVVQGLGGGKKTTTTTTPKTNNNSKSSNGSKTTTTAPKTTTTTTSKPTKVYDAITGTTSTYKAPTNATEYANSKLTNNYNIATANNASANRVYDATLDSNNNITYTKRDTTNNNNGGGSSGSSSSTSSYYDDLMAAFMEMNSANREAALEAILQNLEAVKGTYKQQIQNVNDEYDQLVNENEVKKDRARRVIRENQANRGQLDSGMGRQEMLDMNIGYDNITTNLKAAREKAVNEIYNLITQAEAEANTNKANVNNSYQNALLEWKLANQ